MVVVPQIVDMSGAIGQGSEEHKAVKHSKQIAGLGSDNVKKEGAALANGKRDERKPMVNEESPVTVVLVICAARPAAIRNHLEQIIKLRPSAERFPIVVSQDGNIGTVTSVIKEFVNESAHISFIHSSLPLLQHAIRTDENSATAKAAKNYFFIAQHYKWALDKIFFEMSYDTAIITEGWMLTADLWKELSPKWPSTYWDDWLRRQDIRNNRACIRPEVSRTAHNNKVAGKGTSGGLYKKYLASIHLPESPIDFSLLNLSYLMKDNYDRVLKKRLNEAKEITVESVENLSVPSAENSYLVVYRTPREYRRIAKAVGLMIDIRSGMPRTAYYGVVTFMLGASRVYAIPASLNVNKNFTSRPTSDFYIEDWDKMTRYLDFQETYCKPGKFAGVCDPKNPELVEWFRKKRLTKRLQSWGEMIVN
ncbi:Putative alpha-1,3-mannosyl-glycoprotein 2-beta-N-acetylglucosaminyltransferase [Toxocara canis]|uniref:Alpha-1,3-mannosyl-glycoprotein 2-beta-N-acetylglucosaminyltransferase n=1 Tax=Toxocara canis TaxID=6265 RepID=A0A0B2VTU9_TOXCA|nr:Putative alpha-1,3-mannosyl-glycoprotein 2-beta-N-acetylglucosaminyltransferase [Toxocara canis]